MCPTPTPALPADAAAQLNAIFEYAGLGVVLSGLEGTVIRCNPAFCEIVGRSAEELARMRFSEYTHPDDLAQEEELVAEMISAGRTTYQLEKRYIHKDGRIVWVRFRGIVLAPEGRPTGGVSLVQDITGEREAAAAARRYGEEIRALVARVEAAREEEKLRLARDLHDDMSQMLTALRIDLRAIEQQVDRISGAPRTLIEHVVSATELIDQAAGLVRRIAGDLSVPCLQLRVVRALSPDHQS